MNLTVLIADDEKDARELLKIHLKQHPPLNLLTEATNGQEAISAIDKYEPDLVFLDINMPDKNGLEVLEKCNHKPLVIFVTAYDEYAIKAFELNAIDYLLKPFDDERFTKAVEKAQQLLVSKAGSSSHYLQVLKDILQQETEDSLQSISVKNGQETTFISVSDIEYIEAADQYVWIHTNQGKHLVRHSMDYLENKLDNTLFFRTHRSAIIRLSEAKSIEQLEPRNMIVHLKSGNSVKLSQSRKALFLSKMGAS